MTLATVPRWTLPPLDDPTNPITLTVAAVVAASMVVTVYRLVRGPTLPDRVVALDLLGFLVVSLMGLFAIVSGRAELLSVALVAALILFLGTAAFAIFLERRPDR